MPHSTGTECEYYMISFTGGICNEAELTEGESRMVVAKTEGSGKGRDEQRFNNGHKV